MGKDALLIGRRGWIALAGRFLIVPGVMLFLCLMTRGLGWMDIPDGQLILSVFTLESAMPVMNQALIMAQEKKSDTRWMAQMLSISCVLAMLILPFWKVFVESL
jgi:predicted permease